MSHYSELYSEINEIIADKTPLTEDCGRICDAACCRGDGNTGMLLFPFEQTKLAVTEKDGVRLAVCPGHCRREDRPLSCRIFPLFPYVTPEGRIRVIPDIRGYNVCPLVRHCEKVRFDRGFRHRLYKVGRVLAKDEACLKFLEETSREIDKLLSVMGI